jgi:hypothetical protein
MDGGGEDEELLVAQNKRRTAVVARLRPHSSEPPFVGKKVCWGLVVLQIAFPISPTVVVDPRLVLLLEGWKMSLPPSGGGWGEVVIVTIIVAGE